jgi:glycosyltransferase involved in cell wall biosynthesis
MKIVLITHHFPPNYKAGAEQYAYRIAQALRRRGHTMEVVCIESISEGSLEPTCIAQVFEGLVVHRLYLDLKQAPNPIEWSFRNPELGQWVKSFLRTTSPDIVHVNSGYLLGGTVPEVAVELGFPTVFTLHDYWFLCPLHTLLRRDGKICEKPVPLARCVWCLLSEKRRHRLPDIYLKGFLGDLFVQLSQAGKLANEIMGVAPLLEMMAERKLYLKQVLERIDLVLSPSQFLIDKVMEYGFRPRQIIHLPLGLDKTHLIGHQSHHLSEKLRIGYLGQFAPHKGVHLLLDAYQKLVKHSNSCELILHGKITEATPYERELLEIERNNPTITFAGPYPNTEVGRILNELDVIVVPSIWYENRPAVILEAFAAGRPVVASRIGGITELIKHNENGLLFEVGSAESLTAQLQRLLDEPTLLPQLRSGIEPVPTVEEETATLISLYKSLLSNPQKTNSRPSAPNITVPARTTSHGDMPA